MRKYDYKKPKLSKELKELKKLKFLRKMLER